MTEELAAWLDDHGLDVWWDTELESRNFFDWQINEKLRTASCVVVIWSEGAVSSDWVIKEASIARDRGILVATKVDELSPDRIPTDFRKYDAHNFQGERNNILRDILAVREGRLLLDDKQEELPSNPTPTMLLQAKFRLVPFVGAEEISNVIVEWVTASGRRDAGRLIFGSGGLGKTRLLIEIAEVMRKRGWSAGFLVRPGYGDRPGDTSETITRRRERRAKALSHLIRGAQDNGLLLIMDYAEGREAEIAQISSEIRARPTTDIRPIRFVLLTRGAGDWWTSITCENHDVRALFGGDRQDIHELVGINSGEARLELFHASVKAFSRYFGAIDSELTSEANGLQEFLAKTWSKTNRVKIIESNSGYEVGEGYDRPLAICMEALLFLAERLPDADTLGIHHLLANVLGIERDHWPKLAPTLRSADGSIDGYRRTALERAAAQVTSLQGVEGRRAAEDLFMADRYYTGERLNRSAVQGVVDSISRIYGRDDVIGQLEPDLVGEHLVGLCVDSELIDGCLNYIAGVPENRRGELRQNLLTVIQRATRHEHGEKIVARVEACILHIVNGYLSSMIDDMTAVISSTPGTMQDVLLSGLRDGTINKPHARNCARTVLLKVAYTRGDLRQEARILADWRRSREDLGIDYYLRMADFLARSSNPHEAVNLSKKALELATDSQTALQVGIALSKSLWAAGCPVAGMAILKELEQKLRHPNELESRHEVEFNHAACVLLHDLEKNAQVYGYAEKCIASYAASGNHLQRIISMVNKGDSLWGLGYAEAAISTLKEAHAQAELHNLPHAVDISALCLANVLAEMHDFQQALQYYDKGISLAETIGHNWDSMYGQIYRTACVADKSKEYSIRPFLELAEASKSQEYHYLRALALSFASYAAWRSQDKSQHQILLEFCADQRLHEFPMFSIYWGAACIFFGEYSRTDSISFLRLIAQCDGMKGRVEFIVGALRILIRDFDLDLYELNAAESWIDRFGIRSSSLSSKPKLKECDFRACEARCCYDGAYLWDEEVDRITKLVSENKHFFSHLPEQFIIYENWHHVSGPKTAVRPHSYKALDFPGHFNSTRCVFAFDDGACSLQRYSERYTSSSWTHKPRTCILFPLEIKGGNACPPPLLPQDDPMHIGLTYPGYSISLPCGQHRSNGHDWDIVLRRELEYLMSISPSISGEIDLDELPGRCPGLKG